jgi:hypothetical protein
MLTVIDEHTRECLAIDVARNLRNGDVLERLAWLMATRGVPKYIRQYTYRLDILEKSMSYEEVTEIFVRVASGTAWAQRKTRAGPGLKGTRLVAGSAAAVLTHTGAAGEQPKPSQRGRGQRDDGDSNKAEFAKRGPETTVDQDNVRVIGIHIIKRGEVKENTLVGHAGHCL